MRTFQLVVVLVLSYSSLAWADVGPRPPPCSAPTDCTVCQKAAGDALTDCELGALDAGKTASECTDRSGAFFTLYYCPPGHEARRCGCGSTEGVGALGVLALFALGARRRG